MLDCLKHVSSGAYELIRRKFADVFKTLRANENVKNINEEFETYCREVIAIGFNSASYNLNLIKQTSISQSLDKSDFVIRKVNNYLCIGTTKLRCLDIPHFVTPFYRKLLKQIEVLIINQICDRQAAYWPKGGPQLCLLDAGQYFE